MKSHRLFATIIIIISLISLQSCDQRNNKVENEESKNDLKIEIENLKNSYNFIEYDTAIKELKANNNFESIEFKYDYIFVLLLDSTEIKLLKKHSTEIIEEFRNYAPGLKNSERSVGFVTEKKDIKDVFTDKLNHKRIFECLHAENSLDIEYLTIDSVIYIKEQSVIFEISGSTWSDTYFAKLDKGVFHINWLGGIIE